MSLALLLFAGLAADGPDLSAIDQAVGKCDTKVMAKTFADEPRRRRAFMIAAFNEQQAIVAARQALAARRMAPVVATTGGPPYADGAALDHEAQALDNQQQALNDARMLNGLREQALDTMRQQYLADCAAGRSHGQD